MVKHGELDRDENPDFFVADIMYQPFFDICKRFNLQRAWHSPIMLPTMVDGQAFRII